MSVRIYRISHRLRRMALVLTAAPLLQLLLIARMPRTRYRHVLDAPIVRHTQIHLIPTSARKHLAHIRVLLRQITARTQIPRYVRSLDLWG